MHRALALACLLPGGLLGCYDEPVPLPQADGGRLDAAPPSPLTLTIEPRAPLQVGADVPLLYVAEALDVGQRLAGTLPPGPWPRTLTLTPAAQGNWRVVVFVDQDQDGVFDDCPFPPRIGDTERALDLDSQSGRVTLAGGSALVALERRTCGPGRPATGVRGVVQSEQPVEGPLWIMLESTDTSLPSLRIPLSFDGLSTTHPFSLGEVLPGRWRVTAFIDADEDATPSPCTATPGGADRWVSATVEVEVPVGARAQLPEPLQLGLLDCPAELTGLAGELALEPGLERHPGLDGHLGPLAGPVRLALFPSAGGPPVAGLTLLPGVDARPLPHRFTATHLPPGAWRLVAWVDRDDDGAFTPCGGLEGIDAVWLQQEDVRVVDGEIQALGALALVRHPCDARAETGLTGTLRAEAEDGPVGSGRPVRLELRPRDGGAILRVPLVENHRTGQRFIASGLPAGRHDLIFHVDTDRDGIFVDCRQAPYADRAALAFDDIELPLGQIVALDVPSLPLLGCAVPRAEVRPRVLFAPGLEAAEAPLRLRVVEQGGYREDRLLLPRHGPDREEPLLEPIRLAPGEFEFTAWLDSNGDGEPGDCAAAQPDAALVRLALRLDAADPQADPTLVLEAPCP